MKYLKFFEEFLKYELNEIIYDKKSYLKIPVTKDKIITDATLNHVLNKIKSCDFNNFKYERTNYGAITITPDSVFKELIHELNNVIDDKYKINVNIVFTITVTKSFANQIDFENGIPVLLRGIGFGYKLYKLLIINETYITTNNSSQPEIYNLWYHLLQDKDFYCFTSNYISGAIYKKTPIYTIKSIIRSLPTKPFYIHIDNINYVYDKELQKIIDEN